MADRDATPEHPEPCTPSRRHQVGVYVSGVVVVVLVILVVVFAKSCREQADAAERARRGSDLARGPEVVVVEAKPAPATRDVTLQADVLPYQRATVYARASGYLDRLLVDRGDAVAAGQLLGTVTTPETTRQLVPLVASYQQKQAIVDRLRPLAASGVVAEVDLERAVSDAQAARSDVDRLREVRRFDEIRAPFAGTITNRYVDVGALMPAPTAATQSAQPLVDVTDLSRVRVVVYVGQGEAAGVRVGTAATVVRPDDPTRPIDAQVTRMADMLDARTRTMWVEIDLDNARGLFRAGVFATATLHVPAPGGVEIPADAIAVIAGQATVAKVERGEPARVRFVKVAVADDDGKVARVVEGLAPGDVLAARVNDEVEDGAVVRAVSEQEAKQRRGGGSGSGGSGQRRGES